MATGKVKLEDLLDEFRGIIPNVLENFHTNRNNIRCVYDLNIPVVNRILKIPLRISYARFYNNKIYFEIIPHIENQINDLARRLGVDINNIVDTKIRELLTNKNFPRGMGSDGNEVYINLDVISPIIEIARIKIINGVFIISDNNNNNEPHHIEYWAGGNPIFAYFTLTEAVNAYKNSEEMWRGNGYRIYKGYKHIRTVTVGDIRQGSLNGPQGYPDSFINIFKEYFPEEKI